MGRRTSRTPVMADVARLAGVSHQTVSRVVNGSTSLRAETRQRVLEAIEQLGYRPNKAARALVTRRSGTIGVIGTKSGFWGPSTVHRAVQAAGRKDGFFVSSVNLPVLTRAEVVDAVEHLREQSVEGIVLVAANDEAVDAASSLAEDGVPVVVVEGGHTRWSVGVDQVVGASLATQHLLDLGHREIVHLAGPQTWAEARGRVQGWQQTMRAAGLDPLEPVFGDWSARSGYQAARLIAERRGVTAVVCANDQMALGLLRALSEAGRSVPGDISVTGFDDIPEAGFMIPPLTTVRQDFAAVGVRAIEIIRAVISADPVAPSGLIRPELVVRESTTGVS